MQQFTVGDQVEHAEFSGFPMKVLKVGECADPDCDEPAYLITDPEEMQDWLCGRQVRPAI